MERITLKDIFKTFCLGIIITLIIFAFCMFIINSQTKNNVKAMANKVVTATEYYMASQILEDKLENVTIIFPNNEVLGIKGNLPTKGYVKIYTDHKTEIKFYYKGYCVTKKTEQNNYKIEKIKEKYC